MSFDDVKRVWKKIWYFIWKDDSLWSWLFNILLAFILVKFIIYPGLGFLLGTTHPVVAVVSDSMNHQGYNFEDWWALNKDTYEDNFNVTEEEFLEFPLISGFSKGDLIVLVGADQLEKGDVIVFVGDGGQPIIHRIVFIEERDGRIFVQTKGDNNQSSRADEIGITEDRVIGRAKFRVPYLGWLKLGFLKLLGRA